MRYLLLFTMLFFSNLLGIDFNGTITEVFTQIYETGEWDRDSSTGNQKNDAKETSGTGSSIDNALIYVEYLKDFFKKKQIKSVVDLGCGDWQISRHIDWKGIEYSGVDVVEYIIERNKKLYGAKNITFIKADGTEFSLPKADVLICKDVLQHLTFKDILSFITQLKKYKYCIIVNDVDPTTLTCENVDMPRGYYRPIDLTKAPFFLKGRKALSYASGLETKQLLLIENKNVN